MRLSNKVNLTLLVTLALFTLATQRSALANTYSRQQVQTIKCSHLYLQSLPFSASQLQAWQADKQASALIEAFHTHSDQYSHLISPLKKTHEFTYQIKLYIEQSSELINSQIGFFNQRELLFRTLTNSGSSKPMAIEAFHLAPGKSEAKPLALFILDYSQGTNLPQIKLVWSENSDLIL